MRERTADGEEVPLGVATFYDEYGEREAAVAELCRVTRPGRPVFVSRMWLLTSVTPMVRHV